MNDEKNDIPWHLTKEKLIREINTTYEAILNFRAYETLSVEHLEAMTMEELSTLLQKETRLLDKLVSEWDVQK